MSRLINVDGVETVESSSTGVVVLVLALLAAVVIAMVVWQPWAAVPATAPQNSTTVIHDTQTQPAPNSQPVIVNPPATQGDTKVEIHNNVPKSDPPTKTGGTGNTP